MAVPVQQNHVRWPARKRQIERRREFSNSMQASATVRALPLQVAAQQRRRIFFDGREATGLAEEDLLAALGNGQKPVDHAFAACVRASASRPCEISGRPQQPGRTTVDRASAAFAGPRRAAMPISGS